MSKKTKMPLSDEEQTKAFRKAARELGADENEDRFKDALRRLAKHKPKAPRKRAKSLVESTS